MIDYIIVIYKNYDLLELQVENFKRLFPNKDYRLIVVDNTPDTEKRIIEACSDPIINNFILCESIPTFDGLSHGKAINEGLKYVQSDIVGIIDSDYFILNKNIHDYVYKKFSQGYKAIGTEYNDGKDTKNWVSKKPEAFENIPVCFGAYYNIPDKLYVGLASSHLPANPNGAYYDLARHYYITAGYDYAVTDMITLKPSIFVKSDAASTALDINLVAMYNQLVWAGVSYRLKDAIAPMVGVQINKLGPGTLKFGYSYDVTTSALKTYSSGSHEIMLGYCFNVTPKPKVITKFYNVRFL